MSKPSRQVSPRASRGDDPLAALCRAVDNYVGELGAFALEAAPPGEESDLIKATALSAKEQTTNLTAYVMEMGSRLSPAQREELNRNLALQNGPVFAARAMTTVRALRAKGIVGRIIDFLVHNLDELKKILIAILHLIFDLLHLRWPPFLDTIFLLIDQIVRFLLSLLAEVFGIDFGRTASALSESEVRFWTELGAMSKLRAIHMAAGRPAPSEEL